MKKFKKYAFIGLIIGLVGALTSLILRLALGQFTLGVQISIIVSVLGLASFVLMDPDTILQFFKGRQAKYGSNSLVLTLTVIAILIVINLFIYNNNVTWDMTEDKVNSLAPETVEILNNLTQSVQAQAFFSSNVSSERANQLLRGFSEEADGLFEFEFIDPIAEPVLANQAGIEQDATIVITSGDQSEKITSVSEQRLINAIIKLQNPEQSTIYTLTGHGELDFVNPGDYALTEIAGVLEAKNYKIESLNLVANPEIPTDAKVIFIAGPQIPLDENEVTLIKDFMNNGGALIVFYEPSLLTQFGDMADPLENYLSTDWGVDFGDDLIVDLSVDPAEIAVAEQYGSHPITEEVSGYITFYPTARSLSLTPIDGINATDLVLTSNRAWGETDMEAILNTGEVGFDENDVQGPLSLAVAMENLETGSRLVVVGDSDFATDAFVTMYANRDFAISICDWTAENEAMITLTPKQNTTRLLLPPTKATRIGIILGGLVGIPLFIAATGIIIGIQRKKNG